MTVKMDEIRSFVAVADEGSFSGAARALGRSQSVVSTHIAGMESELGFRLFTRTNPVTMTPAAQALMPNARRVLLEASRFESRAAALFHTPEPLLYMGIDMGLEIPLVLDLLRDFSRRYPSAKVQLENISSSESNWFFRRAAMTMAVVFSPRPDPECEERLIGLSPQVIAVSKKHPLASLTDVTTDDLRSYRQLLVTARDSESTPPVTVSTDTWEVDSPQWALGLAARGIGWTLLPKAVALTQPGLRTTLALLDAPVGLPNERLVLRLKPDEVPADYADWWESSLRKIARRLGLLEPMAEIAH